MLTIKPIVDHLQQGGFKSVEGVLEAPTQADLPNALPALHVVPAVESAEASQMAGRRDQRVTFNFSVFVTVGTRLARGAVSDELQKQVQAVKDAVVGWTHPQASGEVDLVGGRLANVSPASVTWEVRLSCRYHYRK
ncbi:phage tail terminator protein [Sphingomonas sp. Marseille-Q8236]